MPRFLRPSLTMSLLVVAGCSDPASHGASTHEGGGTDSAASFGDPSTGVSSTAGSASSTPTGGADSTDGDDSTGDVPDPTQPLSPNLVVDQFGYRVGAEKLAVVRSPMTGFDAGTAFTPGASYQLVDAVSGQSVFEGAPVPWSGGAVDASSGDIAWRFDFSEVATPGQYYVLDVEHQVRSDVFRIADDVYADVLAQAVRMLFYQRDGFAKEAQFAGDDWADGASYVGPGQGPACELHTGGSPRDLHGGWWDAGDVNKYTNWSASYALGLLRSYREHPSAFADDYGIPESGNGVPDVLDELKWNLDWLVRMQGPDGSVLSIVGQDGPEYPPFGGDPDTSPSHVTAACHYGPASTSATLSTAAAFAFAAQVYAAHEDAFPGFADDLAARAEAAWSWAEANPAEIFYNGGVIGAGEQEVDDHGRDIKRLQAAVFLFGLTGDTSYRAVVDANLGQTQLMNSGYLDMFAVEEQDALLEYAGTANATPARVDEILAAYAEGVASGNNLGALQDDPDPYLAYTYVYVWGSNQVKADQGNLLFDVVAYDVPGVDAAAAARAAERYVHYIHGVNPLQLVYLSTMQDFGASNSVRTIYHAWFSHGSLWDETGVSMYGPPPGYLVGGPNPSYAWDGCCPGGCSGYDCGAAPLSPPSGQPPQKSYAQFNDGWPIDSWSVTEPSNGYQIRYIRLLSKFVG